MVEGDKIILGSDDEKVERITAEDIKVNLSWRGGNLFFRGESLEKIIEGLVGLSEAPAITRERHRQALTACNDALHRSMNAHLPELAAEDLRLAIRDLGRITGRVDVEDLLDVVFRDFCIGK